MALFEGAVELDRLVAQCLPPDVVDRGPPVFGLVAPAGAAGALHVGVRIVDALLSGMAELSAEDQTAGGIVVAGSRDGLWVLGASRPGRPLQSARWVTRGAPVVLPWADAARSVQVERPNTEQVFLTLPVDGEPRRYLFWNGVPGLPDNLAGALQIVRALGHEP